MKINSIVYIILVLLLLLPIKASAEIGGFMAIPDIEKIKMEKVSSCQVVKDMILSYMDRSDQYSRDNSKYETRANSLVLLYIRMNCNARSLALDIPRNTE